MGMGGTLKSPFHPFSPRTEPAAPQLLGVGPQPSQQLQQQRVVQLGTLR